MTSTTSQNVRRPVRGMGTFSANALAITVLAFSLSACDRETQTKVGNKLDSTVASAEQRTDEAKSEMKEQIADAKAEAKSATAAMGQKVDDAAITAAINAELAKDSKLSAMKINVDTSNGEVSLLGTAPDAESRDRATSLASNVKGVTKVNNQLKVSG